MSILDSLSLAQTPLPQNTLTEGLASNVVPTQGRENSPAFLQGSAYCLEIPKNSYLHTSDGREATRLDVSHTRARATETDCGVALPTEGAIDPSGALKWSVGRNALLYVYQDYNDITLHHIIPETLLRYFGCALGCVAGYMNTSGLMRRFAANAVTLKERAICESYNSMLETARSYGETYKGVYPQSMWAGDSERVLRRNVVNLISWNPDASFASLKQAIAWNPGNLFTGPNGTCRSDDPGENGMERAYIRNALDPLHKNLLERANTLLTNCKDHCTPGHTFNAGNIVEFATAAQSFLAIWTEVAKYKLSVGLFAFATPLNSAEQLALSKYRQKVRENPELDSSDINILAKATLRCKGISMAKAATSHETRTIAANMAQGGNYRQCEGRALYTLGRSFARGE